MAYPLKVVLLLLLLLLLGTLANLPGGAGAQEPRGQAQSERVQHLGAREHSSRELLACEVIDGSGETLGKVADLLLDSRRELERVVIERGGVLGLASDRMTVAAAAIELDEGCPLEFDDDADQAGGTDTLPEADSSVAGMIGSTLANRRGDSIGVIHDIILDADGRARHVVVALRGVADESRRYGAVPFASVVPAESGAGYVADLAGQTPGEVPAQFRYEP